MRRVDGQAWKLAPTLKSQALRSKWITFHHMVVGPRKPKLFIGGVGVAIFGLDIQSDADDVAVVLGLLFEMAIETLEDAGSAMFGMDIDALNPPEESVSPIAPLESEGDLADDLAREFGEVVSALRGICQQRGDSGPEQGEVEPFAFALEGEAGVVIDDEIEIVGGRRADAHGCPTGGNS